MLWCPSKQVFKNRISFNFLSKLKQNMILFEVSCFSNSHFEQNSSTIRQSSFIWFFNDFSRILLTCTLMSVRLWNFKDGGSLKARFLAKNQYTPRKLLYFVNIPNARFNSNYHTYQFLELCPIFVDSALCVFTKYNNFLGLYSVLA